jgi:hypothetical protein
MRNDQFGKIKGRRNKEEEKDEKEGEEKYSLSYQVERILFYSPCGGRELILSSTIEASY